MGRSRSRGVGSRGARAGAGSGLEAGAELGAGSGGEPRTEPVAQTGPQNLKLDLKMTVHLLCWVLDILLPNGIAPVASRVVCRHLPPRVLGHRAGLFTRLDDAPCSRMALLCSWPF